MASEASLTFKEHFSRLERIAKKMQSGETPDVDELLEDVRAATESHAACRARIDAGIEELDKLLGQQDAAA